MVNGHFKSLLSMKHIQKIYNQVINVPFPVESSLSGIEQRIDSNMFLWYKREFLLPFNSTDRILLHFDKVDYETVLYLNDHPVGLRTFRRLRSVFLRYYFVYSFECSKSNRCTSMGSIEFLASSTW